MRKLAETCERIAGTSKKLEKIAIVAEYLKACAPEEALCLGLIPLWPALSRARSSDAAGRRIAAVAGRRGGFGQKEPRSD